MVPISSVRVTSVHGHSAGADGDGGIAGDGEMSMHVALACVAADLVAQQVKRLVSRQVGQSISWCGGGGAGAALKMVATRRGSSGTEIVILEDAQN